MTSKGFTAEERAAMKERALDPERTAVELSSACPPMPNARRRRQAWEEAAPGEGGDESGADGDLAQVQRRVWGGCNG
jgi:hypothetical protein